MSKIQIYLHGENARDAKLIEVSENASVKEILDAYSQAFRGGGHPDEIEIFLEDHHEALHKDHLHHMRKRAHFHCHRCKKIVTTIFYNGEDKVFHFSPASLTTSIMKEIIKAFNINHTDAGDYLLKLDDKTILQPADHIGSFVSFPHCQVKLFLTPTQPIQG